MSTKQQRNSEKMARFLIQEYGESFAEQADIRLKDKPMPLFQLLLLSLMLSARISTNSAVQAARALFRAGLRTPLKLESSTWQRRVDVITEAGYKRYDEKASKQLGQAAEFALERYSGDLRNLRQKADGDPLAISAEIQNFKGIGELGANIFIREVQAVWPEFYPYADRKVLKQARKMGLPTTVEALADLCSKQDFFRLVSALMRV